MRITSITLTLLACSLSACGSDLSGTWKGSEVGTVGGSPVDTEMTATIKDDGDGGITGTWITSGGASGTLSGTVDDDSLEISIAEDDDICVGTYTGTFTVDGDTMGGTVAGTADCGAVSVELDLAKVE